MAALRPGRRRDQAAQGSSPAVGVILGLLAFFLTQYASALSVPFINDDYVFLDKTRAAGFLQLWRLEDLTFHWYRPWSRELHYWTLQRWFGVRELPFHLASLALWLAVLATFWALARRLAGARAATVATAAMTALAAWGVPVLWVAGVQELWMLFFSLLVLHAALARRTLLATLALTGALLSKETAAVVVGIAFAGLVTVGGRKPLEAMRETLPLLIVTALWAVVHPVLGGRLAHPFADPLEPGERAWWIVDRLRTALVSVNLDAVPRPERGWGSVLLPGLSGAIVLGGMVALGARGPRANGETPAPRAVIACGALWALLGWAPLLMPSLGWHAYYALLGCFGVWLALAPLVARHATVAVAVVASLALLRPARADTPSLDWGSEWYQRRAAEFIGTMRDQLLAAQPRLPSHSRLFFVRIPSNVGFLAGDGPAIRIWYGDPTLKAGFYSAYHPRGPEDPSGPDLFFRYDRLGGWVEVVSGPEDVARARRANPRWEKDHVSLARTLASGGDWRRAAVEYAKLADASPGTFDYAFDAAVCFETLGDSTAAAAWYRRAAALPGADAEALRAVGRVPRLRGGL